MLLFLDTAIIDVTPVQRLGHGAGFARWSCNHANLLGTTYNRPIGLPFLGFFLLLAALLGLWVGVTRRG
jgi:hypothetical protein